MTVVNYDAPPTIAKFMRDDSIVRVLLGPVGSGKTTGMAMEMARRMVEEVPDTNGIRKTRNAVIRNTSQQLRQTVLPEIEKWLQPAFRYKVTDSTLEFRFSLQDGTRIESDWMMIPLDTARDIQRLLSLNLSYAWISECREVPVEIVDSLLGRVGRFRSHGVTKSNYYGVMMESNMPDEDSDWYTKLEIERPPTWKVFKQPGGLEPNAENVENLRSDYYQNLLENNSSDWSDIYIHAKYGKSLSGQAVFRASFRPDFHVTYNDIKPIPGRSLMLGQDFGRTPATLIGQIDNRGRLVIFRECATVDMGIEQFCVSELRPTMFQYFPGATHFMIGDPTGRYKGQITEESPFDALKRLNFKIYPAPTNDIEPRLRAVEQLFLRQVEGGPMLLICGHGCPQLVQALKFHYRYRRKQTGQLEELPEKTHPWSDLVDCLQYMALGASGNYMGKVLTDSTPRTPRVRPSAAGWT